jgi:hypothetical protein
MLNAHKESRRIGIQPAAVKAASLAGKMGYIEAQGDVCAVIHAAKQPCIVQGRQDKAAKAVRIKSYSSRQGATATHDEEAHAWSSAVDSILNSIFAPSAP